MTNFIILDSSDKSTWKSILSKIDNYVGQHIYYSLDYLELYNKSAASKSEAFVYQKNNQYFYLTYIKNLISRQLTENNYYDFETPYGYGGPISTTNDTKFLFDAWSSFKDYCNKNFIIAGLIRFDPLLKNHSIANQPFIKLAYEGDVVVNSLNLSKEEIWNNYSSSTRNKVRKAIKNDIKIRNLKSLRAVNLFKHLYFSSMREKDANENYFFSNGYFNKIFDRLNKNFNLFLAYKKSYVVGGALILCSKKFISLHLSATKKKYLKYGVSSLLRHEIINYYLKEKIEKINFGGGLTKDKDDPLLVFKKGLSKKTEEYYIGKCIFDNKLYNKLCKAWNDKYKKNNEKFSNYFLKYRYIN